MEVTTSTEKFYNLKLTAVEASWLKAVMQNPLFDVTPDQEDSFDKEMRHKLFHSLEWC